MGGELAWNSKGSGLAAGILARSSVGWSDREAPPPHVVDIVYGALNSVGDSPLVYQNVDALDVVGLVAVLRLIQSQTQSGPASAKALEHNPQAHTLIFFQDIEQL
jgi:hypothetical protein